MSDSEIASKGYVKAIKTNHEIMLGLNMMGGKITYRGVAEAFGMEYTEPMSVLG